jgi:hypothetical protein
MTKIDQLPDNQKDFAASIMQKIEAEHITTHSRLRFILHDAAFWTLWFVSALVGAFALSAIVFVLSSSIDQLYWITHDSFLSYATNSIPFVWLFLFAIMCIFAHINLRHTPKGYRHSSSLLILLNLTVTVLLAVIITAAGLGKFIDEEVGKHVPLYVPAQHRQELDWFKPDEGLLIGQVISADRTVQLFVLRSPDAEELNVDGHLLSDDEWELLAVPAMHVRVIGVDKTPDPFTACVVLPAFPSMAKDFNPDFVERNLLEPRSTECKGVRPYDRFDQLKHW